PAALRLLAAQGRRDARGQRRLGAAAGGDGDAHRAGAQAAPARRERGAMSRGARRMGVLPVLRCLLLPLVALLPGALACGGGGKARSLNVYIWTNYLPASVVSEFERRSGIHVEVDTYSSNEALLEKLQSGVADYDVVVPSDYLVQVLAQQGLL